MVDFIALDLRCAQGETGATQAHGGGGAAAGAVCWVDTVKAAAATDRTRADSATIFVPRELALSCWSPTSWACLASFAFHDGIFALLGRFGGGDAAAAVRIGVGRVSIVNTASVVRIMRTRRAIATAPLTASRISTRFTLAARKPVTAVITPVAVEEQAAEKIVVAGEAAARAAD